MRRIAGNTLKGISLVLLLLFAGLFASDALDNGKLPLIAIAAFLLAGLTFWIGERLNPN
ncbi:MAG: hypothetical protein ABR611_15270 [Chthoniobacterales bacterium]